MKLLILADDFTGAMDTGVQLSQKNIKTLVFPDIPEDSFFLEECQVLVINTNLRHEKPDKAYQVIETLVQRYYRPGLHIYIKTDSALRGNISAYLEAASQTLQLPLHFIPAFPDANRTTRNATVYIDGELLELSVFNKDPRSPMTKSYIPDIMGGDLKLPINKVSDLKGSLPEPGSLSLPISLEPAIYLYDGESNEDLEKIAHFLKEEDQLTLTAGCAGFASQFPKVLDFKQEVPYQPAASSPVLFLSGSANAVTFGQLKCAKESGYPLLSMSAYLKASFENKPDAKPLEDQLVTLAIDHLNSGHCVLLATAVDQTDLFDLDHAREILGSREAIHQMISMCCSSLAKRILDGTTLTNIVVFGGDTVASILQTLHCPMVEAKGQLSTGVPLCLLEYEQRTLHLVTKSGGLGRLDIVKTIDHYFNK